MKLALSSSKVKIRLKLLRKISHPNLYYTFSMSATLTSVSILYMVLPMVLLEAMLQIRTITTTTMHPSILTCLPLWNQSKIESLISDLRIQMQTVGVKSLKMYHLSAIKKQERKHLFPLLNNMSTHWIRPRKRAWARIYSQTLTIWRQCSYLTTTNQINPHQVHSIWWWWCIRNIKSYKSSSRKIARQASTSSLHRQK